MQVARATAALALTLLSACHQATPPAPAVTHLVTARYQPAGDPSTAAVPTAVVGGERRPALAVGPRERVFRMRLQDHPDVGREVELTIPEALRGRTLELSATHNGILPVAVTPSMLSAPGPSATVSLAYGGVRRPSRGTTDVYAQAAPEERWESAPLVVPPGARLRFAVGVADRSWSADLPAAEFSLTAATADGERRLFTGRVDPARNPTDRRWLDQDLDLAPLAGQTVRLRFEVRPSVAHPGFQPVWGDPTIVVPAERPRRLNVILFSLDTLRADHLGCYGYPRPTSPRIDADLAARGAVFEHAYAHYPGTRGSHMALLSSIHACVHGAPPSGPWPPMRADAHTLAELLRAQGYTTGAFTEDAFVTAALGFARGFGVWVENEDRHVGGPSGQAEKTFADALAWIERQESPWFAFVHTYQVHEPYTPPPGYRERVTPEPGPGRAAEKAALYDGEIRYTDELLGRFLDRLAALGRADDTLIVVTSDHGDQFGEHDLWGHGNSLYDAVLHVVLLMRAPGLVPAGRRIAAPVGLIDVVPTVLALLDLPPLRWTQGRSLVPLLEARDLPPVTLWAEQPALGLVSARTATHKWIFDGDRHARAFDVVADPDETNDVAPTLPAGERERLLGEHAALCAVRPAPAAAGATADLDPAVREKLRALGYVE